jgi:hypothetical protein
MRICTLFFCISLPVLAITGCFLGSDLENGTEPDIVWHTVGEAGEPDFQNNWDNELNTTTQTLKFGLDNQGFLHIVGDLRCVLSSISKTVIFTLPAKFIPTKIGKFTAVGYNNGKYLVEEVDIVPNTGNVTVTGAEQASSSYLLYLGHISIKMD